MQIIILLILTNILIFASYNPFFQDIKSTSITQSQKIIKKPKKNIIYKPRPTRKNIQLTYFGFIHSKKGRFALVNFQNQNIVIKKNDSLYDNANIFKIKKITSNYILINDKYHRTQTIYFSSKTVRSN